MKSDAASFAIPELEFESPAFSQKGGKEENSRFFSPDVLGKHIHLIKFVRLVSLEQFQLIGVQKLVVNSILS